MNEKIKRIEKLVRREYEARDPDRADWSDWLYQNHVFIVGDFAKDLAMRYKAPIDQCYAAAILHDIADARMSRFAPNHEQASLEIARELLVKANFDENEQAVVVDDAIALHSCRDGNKPKTLVGKILATADALAHLKTDFYSYATENLMAEMPEGERQLWAQNKIPRDYYEKIAFDEIREEAKPYYEKLCSQFDIV